MRSWSLNGTFKCACMCVWKLEMNCYRSWYHWFRRFRYVSDQMENRPFGNFSRANVVDAIKWHRISLISFRSVEKKRIEFCNALIHLCNFIRRFIHDLTRLLEISLMMMSCENNEVCSSFHFNLRYIHYFDQLRVITLQLSYTRVRNIVEFFDQQIW